MQDLAIIALKYVEPDWQQTRDCLSKLDYPVFYADRDGVGNMSRAFNDAFDKHVKGRFRYVWFITNITFDPSVPGKLLSTLKYQRRNKAAAAHPKMATSDHVHLKGGIDAHNEVPFVELTAPMFRADVFQLFYLCEETPYYYMDLIISHDLREEGFKLLVVNDAEVHHTYLRNSTSQHPISDIRKRLRNIHTPISKQYMINTYGPDWEAKLWPR